MHVDAMTWMRHSSRIALMLVPVQLADIVAARAEDSKNYGIILLPEGLIEHVPEVSIHPDFCILQTM